MQDQSLSKQPQKPECYQSGNILPPKRRTGIVTTLLILVIVLSGIVSIVGLMNIHLFRALLNQKEESNALAFESAPNAAQTPVVIAVAPTSVGGRTAIGISAQDITPFDAAFYRIPQGVYVTSVSPDTDAHHQGLRARDIILAFDGIQNLSCESLRELLDTRLPGDKVTLTIYRRGSRINLQITLFEEEN